MRIDGVEVYLNGFVADVLQEVVTGVVRSLGDENERGRIEITVAAGEGRSQGE